MKKMIKQMMIALLALPVVGCSASFLAASNGAANDLYGSHNRTQIAQRQQAEAEARKAEAEAQRAQWEARLAEAQANQAQQNYYNASSGENFQSVLADDYESAYARRLRALDDASYNMPSSYTNARYSTSFQYASAYDPAFYNVMVMGDQVWVEPKYVTAMFGTWGRPVYYNPWYYGWAGPSYSLSFSSWGWSVGFSWYDPWFYDPWYSPYYAYYNPWYGPWYNPWYNPWYDPWYGPHHHHHYPHYGPGGHGPHHPHYRPGGGNVVHRPTNRPAARPYGGSGTTVNRGSNGNRNWSSGVYQGGSSGRNNNRNNSGVSNSTSRNPSGNKNNSSYNNSNNSNRS